MRTGYEIQGHAEIPGVLLGTTGRNKGARKEILCAF